jgi:hypothetical protein
VAAPKGRCPQRRASIWRIDPTDLPTVVPDTERWDDVPAVSEDLLGARAAIGRHLERLVEDLYQVEFRPSR